MPAALHIKVSSPLVRGHTRAPPPPPPSPTYSTSVAMRGAGGEAETNGNTEEPSKKGGRAMPAMSSSVAERSGIDTGAAVTDAGAMPGPRMSSGKCVSVSHGWRLSYTNPNAPVW